MKFHLPVLEYVKEGTVSQTFNLGPSFYSMKYRTKGLKELLKVTLYLI